MNETQRKWQGRSDEELIAAGRQLIDYTVDGETAIRAELRRRGLDEPPLTPRPVTGVSAAKEGSPRPPALHTRYTDAYRVASSIVFAGTVIKVIGAVIAGIVAIAGFMTEDGPISGTPAMGLIVALAIGLIFWIAGVLVTAKGQLLRATVDTAVSSSPLLDNAEKKHIMGV